MKIILLLSLTFNLLFANKVEIDLEPTKIEQYNNKQEIGTLSFNVFPNKHMFYISNDVSKLKNPLYMNNEEKAFWLLTDGFIEVIKRYKFKNSKYIYFAFYDDRINSAYENIYLQIDVEKLKMYNNRDFSNNDKTVIQDNTLDKYKLPPVRELFKSAKIMTNVDQDLKVSDRLSKAYHIFIEEFTFSSVGRFEISIENNQEIIQELIENIHYYSLSGEYDKVKIYLELGFDVNKKDTKNNQTLLEYAVVGNRYDVVKLLIKNGANPNIHKKNTENAYLFSKRNGYTKIEQLLKPITTMTEYPETINSVIFSTLDLRNMCLGSSGKYGNFCYKIENTDLKNTCLGITQHSNFCYKIENTDLKNTCLGITQHSNFCHKIENTDLKNTCLGITQHSNFCHKIQDNNLQSMCLGVSSNFKHCYNID